MNDKPTIPVLAPPQAREPLLGVDGGGTKTHAVIINSSGRVLGEGMAGPSNPLRVGIHKAASAIREAVDRACDAADVHRPDVVAGEVGLAGARREDLRERMRESLTGLVNGPLEVVSDSDIALYGATGGKPGLVVIAGTGSVCCGLNTRGQRACVGGWGPVAGDEGSGSWIARRALQSVAQAVDGRGPFTSLTEAACVYFSVATPEDLLVAIYAPSMTNSRIAGFSRNVIEAARADDAVALGIVIAAGHELGVAVVALIRKLHMQREAFQVGYVGGVFAGGPLVLDPLSKDIARVAPKAFLLPPVMPPAVAAAHMAGEHLDRLALAS